MKINRENTLATAIKALTLTANPCFDQLLWDAERHVLSFRYPGPIGYINLWLDVDDLDDGWCFSERNGGPAADSVVLWESLDR
jgi:hypothetical protein